MNPDRVLVADAHSLERLGIVEVLKLAFSCERFDAAASFSDLSASLHKDTGMVVIDDKLPGLTTFEKLRELRVANPLTKFVIVSAKWQPSEVFAGLMAGANGFIPKTLNTDEMIEALRFVSAGHVYVPDSLADGGVIADDDSLKHGWRRIMELSSRQRQVLQLACEGSSNKEIARALAISDATVKAHIAAAFRTIGVTNRIHAAALFHQYRLLQDDAPVVSDDRQLRIVGGE
jgi:DNA-binding NarL/FixJ family response regulator